MIAKLTSRTVKALKPRNKPYDVRDTDIKGFLLRVSPSNNMTYYLQYRNADGLQKHYKIGTVGSITPVQARDIAGKKAGEIAKGIDIQEHKKIQRKSAERSRSSTLGGFLNKRYRDWSTEHRKDSVENIKRIERNFSNLFARPLSEINSWVIEKWRTERLKSGISKVTVNRDVSALKGVISKAVEWEIIPYSPLAKVKPLKVQSLGKVRYLTDIEETSLKKNLNARDMKIINERASCNEWRRAWGYELLPNLLGCKYADHLTPIVLLGLNTGLRKGELFDLSWSDINLKIKTLTVQGETSKSGETRYIPLNADAVSILKQWREQNTSAGYVFPAKDGKRLRSIQTSWENVIKDSKIKNFRFHDLRHSFASKLVMKGVPLNTVRELLGHGDLKTTLRYAHLAPDHKADAVALLNS